MARVARGGIPLTPARMKELLCLCQVPVLRDVQYDGRPMDEDRCFQALRELAGLNNGFQRCRELSRIQVSKELLSEDAVLTGAVITLLLSILAIT